jgi:hypothetical protein
MPNPGLAASKLTSKADNSFAKRVSELGANIPSSATRHSKTPHAQWPRTKRVSEASTNPPSTWVGGWQG